MGKREQGVGLGIGEVAAPRRKETPRGPMCMGPGAAFFWGYSSALTLIAKRRSGSNPFCGFDLHDHLAFGAPSGQVFVSSPSVDVF